MRSSFSLSSAASIPSTEEASFWVSFFLLFQHLSTYSHRHNAAGLCHLLLSPRCRADATPLRLLPLRGKLDPEYLLISICHAAVFLFSFTLPFRFYWNFHIFFASLCDFIIAVAAVATRYFRHSCCWSITKKNSSIGVTRTMTIGRHAVDETVMTIPIAIHLLVRPKAKISSGYCKSNIWKCTFIPSVHIYYKTYPHRM